MISIGTVSANSVAFRGIRNCFFLSLKMGLSESCMNNKVPVSFVCVFLFVRACVWERRGLCVFVCYSKSGVDWTFQVWRHRVHVIQILFRI